MDGLIYSPDIYCCTSKSAIRSTTGIPMREMAFDATHTSVTTWEDSYQILIDEAYYSDLDLPKDKSDARLWDSEHNIITEEWYGTIQSLFSSFHSVQTPDEIQEIKDFLESLDILVSLYWDWKDEYLWANVNVKFCSNIGWDDSTERCSGCIRSVDPHCPVLQLNCRRTANNFLQKMEDILRRANIELPTYDDILKENGEWLADSEYDSAPVAEK